MLWKLLLVVIAVIVIATSNGCSLPPRHAPAQEAGAAHLAQQPVPVEAFADISLTVPPAIAATLRPEVVPASPLEDPTHKPGYVAPRHIRVDFEGQYAERHARSFFRPEVAVYPIDELMEAFALSPQYRENRAESIAELRSMIDSRAAIPKDVPYVLFLDASTKLEARVRHLDFHGGSGIAFVAHYTIDTFEVDPDGLQYIFQGLTDDGRFLVVATFPFRATSQHDRFTMRPDEASAASDYYAYYFKPAQRSPSADQIYGRYKARVAAVVDGPNKGPFDPEIELFDDLIRSIRIAAK